MHISKNKKVRFAIITGLLILIVAGLWVWRFKFKSSADTAAHLQTFTYPITQDLSKFTYTANISISSDGLVSMPPIKTTFYATPPILVGIDNFTELGSWGATINKTKTLFSQLQDGSAVVGILNNKNSSLNSNNRIETNTPFVSPIIFNLDPVYMPNNSIIKNINVTVIHKLGSGGRTMNAALSTDASSVRNALVKKNSILINTPDGQAYPQTYTSKTGDTYQYSFENNDTNGLQKKWTAEDMKKLYFGLLPFSKSNSSYYISTVRVTVEFASTDKTNDSGMVALAETNLDNYNSKSDSTIWQKIDLTRVTTPANSVAIIQWYAGSSTNVLADIAKAKANNEFLTSCTSNCSLPITLPTGLSNAPFTSLLKNAKGLSPVGRYGGFVLKYAIANASVDAPRIDRNILVTANIPLIYSPKISSVPQSAFVGKPIIVKGSFFKPTDKVYLKADNLPDKYYLTNLVFKGATEISGVVPFNAIPAFYYIYVEDPDSDTAKASTITSVLLASASTCPENIVLNAYYKNPGKPLVVKVTGNKFSTNNNVFLKSISDGKTYPIPQVFYIGPTSLNVTLGTNIPVGKYNFYVEDKSATCSEAIKADKEFLISLTPPPPVPVTVCPEAMTISKIASADLKVASNSKIVKADTNDKGTLVVITGKNFGTKPGSLQLVDVKDPKKTYKINQEVVGTLTSGTKTYSIYRINWTDTVVKFYMPTIDTDWDKNQKEVDATAFASQIGVNSESIASWIETLKKLVTSIPNKPIGAVTLLETKPVFKVKDFTLQLTKSTDPIGKCATLKENLSYARAQVNFKFQGPTVLFVPTYLTVTVPIPYRIP